MFGNLRVWAYADGEGDHICRNLCLAGQRYRECAVHVLRKRFGSIT